MARTHQRICYGEFDFPDGVAKQTYVRNRFLEAIARHASYVCEDLYCLPLTLYRQLCSEGLTWDAIVPWTGITGHPKISQLWFQIDVWLQDCNLTEGWCRRIAYATLQRWSRESVKPTELHLATDTALGWALRPIEAPQGLPLYEPIGMSRERYLDLAHRETLLALADEPRPGKQKISVGTRISTRMRRAKAYCEKVEEAYRRGESSIPAQSQTTLCSIVS